MKKWEKHNAIRCFISCSNININEYQANGSNANPVFNWLTNVEKQK